MNKGLRHKLICLFMTMMLAAGSMVALAPQPAFAASGPRKTTFISVVSTTYGFWASWNTQTGSISGYQIRYRRKGDSASKIREVSGQASYSVAVAGLQPGKRYYVNIRTYRGSGDKKSYSGWSGTKTVNVKWSKWQKSARSICRYLRKRGLDNTHIAAILGNMYLESGLDPTSVETIFDESFRIGPRKKAAANAGFRMTKINRKYAKKYPLIVRAGIGVLSWTDTKDMMKGHGANTQLRAYAKSKGKKWYNIYSQLGFFWNGRGYAEGYRNWHARSRFEKAKTVNSATHVFTCYWVSGWTCSKSKAYHNTIDLKGRQAQARRFYRFITKGYYR